MNSAACRSAADRRCRCGPLPSVRRLARELGVELTEVEPTGAGDRVTHDDVKGGGYIGLELGSVYAALGSRVRVVEMLDRLLPGADTDLVRPLAKKLQGEFEGILLETKVASVREQDDELRVQLERADGESEEQAFDAVLVSVGRRPNSSGLGLDNTKVGIDDRGFVVVDAQRRTAEPSIWAIGDVAGEPMLPTRPRTRAGSPWRPSPARRPHSIRRRSPRWCSPIRRSPGAA
jgi:NADPH-dependent 2,4-dienoyl-CoA reductase/sulfur reductase-like enzyme